MWNFILEQWTRVLSFFKYLFANHSLYEKNIMLLPEEPATQSSQEDGDPDELCLKWDSKRGVFTESTSAKRTPLKYTSATQTSPEQQKPAETSSSEEDTSFWRVIDDHKGEHRSPAPSFYDSPPPSPSLRCHVFFPLVARRFWAHILPGNTVKRIHRKELSVTSDELWIRFPGVAYLETLQKASVPTAFRVVTGRKGNREILLSITRQYFRHWSEGPGINDILIGCFNSDFKLVIIGGQQKTEVANLKAWLTREFRRAGNRYSQESFM